MCAFVWLPEYINGFSEIKVFKCFLCACAANDAGCEATGGPPQELVAKRLVYIYIYIYRKSGIFHVLIFWPTKF